jgi:hypothetical protein
MRRVLSPIFGVFLKFHGTNFTFMHVEHIKLYPCGYERLAVRVNKSGKVAKFAGVQYILHQKLQALHSCYVKLAKQLRQVSVSYMTSAI